MALENYLGAMGILPDPLGAANQGILNNIQFDTARAQAEALRAKTAALQQQSERDNLFRQEIDGLDPSDPTAVSRMMARFPEYADKLKGAFDVQDAETKRNNLLYASQVYGAAVSGDTKRAAELARKRYEADLAAGQADDDDLALVTMLESGNPQQQKAALTQLGIALAAEVGPDKFAQTFGELQRGQEGVVVKDSLVNRYTGAEMFRAPESQKFQKVNNPDGSESIIPLPRDMGSVGNDFIDFYNGFLAPAEGGYVASDGRSGSPAKYGVNQAANPDIDVKSLSQEQAAQILHDRYWVPSGASSIKDPSLRAIVADTAVNMGVATAKNMLKASGGDPQKYLSMREARYRRIGGKDLPGWLNRNDALRNYAVNGQQIKPIYTTPGTKPGYTTLTAVEVKAAGLPEGTVAQRGPDGQINVINKPDKDDSDAPYSQSALDAFDRAINTATRLKTHPGLQSAVGAKGITGGLLGGWVVPGTNAADFAAELEAMKAQVFLPMVQSMKGMGALSNAEGEKLTAAIGALSTSQSEGQFLKSLDRIISDLEMYRSRGAPKQAAKNPNGLPVGWSVRVKK
jgi:hypothetical protein